MYWRAKKSIEEIPPPGHTCMCSTQHGRATYSDIAYAICSEVNSSQAYYVIEYEDKETEDIVKPGEV